MNNIQSSKKLRRWVFFICLAVSSCSNKHNQEIADNINQEFELTYQYVVNNMPVKIDHSNNFSSFRRINKDAFTSIAYTWHTISLDACELNINSSRESSKTSYERMTNKSATDNNLSKKIIESDRPCLASIYFDNWPNINNMLLLSYPNFK